MCESKRSFFEDILLSPSAFVFKNLWHYLLSSPASIRLAPPPSPFDHLQVLFPHMNIELLERALLECGNDIDTDIKRLQELCLETTRAIGESLDPVEELGTNVEQVTLTNDGEVAATVTV